MYSSSNRTLLVGSILCCLVLAILAGGAVVSTEALQSQPDGSIVESTAIDESPSVGTNSTFQPCAGGPANATSESIESSESAVESRIVQLYPNPTSYANVGEYVVIEFPAETTLNGWSITDGHTTAELPNETVSGRIAFTMDSEVTANMTPYRTVELDGYVRFAADGDRIVLHDGDETVDQVRYNRASEGDLWHRGDDATGSWWPRGATCREPAAFDTEEATVFVLPDSPDVPVKAFESAEDRILLAGYTFTSEQVTHALLSAVDSGVDVSVLVESGPVGGLPEPTDDRLDELDDGGVDVRVIGGSGARYIYHHAKYAIVDDTAIVTSENWKPSGTGGAGNRGWGVLVEEPSLASHLESVFRTDSEGRDTIPWDSYREEATVVEADEATGMFEPAFEAERVAVDSVELLLAPDNAETRLVDYLQSATDSILIKQASIRDRDMPLMTETLEAARRGVEVRILLDSTWYVEDDNRETVEWLQEIADDEDLPLEVKLVEPRNRFDKIHAKGVVVDEEIAVVGSANWNEHSMQENREVLLVLHGGNGAAYYTDVFESDWEEGTWPLPVGMVGVTVLCLAGGALVGRSTLTFRSRSVLSSTDSRRYQQPPSSRRERR